MNPFGLKVTWSLAEHDGGHSGEGVVIGTHRVADDVWVVANEDSHGMPVNRCWCSWSGKERDTDAAARYRDRYLSSYGSEALAQTKEQDHGD